MRNMLGSEIRFPLQSKRENLQRFSLLFCMPGHGGLGTCDLKTPLPGAGGVCRNSRTARAQRECESRFPLQSKRENLPKVLPLLVLRLQSGCLRPRIFRIPWISRGSSGLVGRKRPDGVFCCRFGRPARRASVGGLLRAIIAAPTTVPHPCVCGASGRVSTPRAP